MALRSVTNHAAHGHPVPGSVKRVAGLEDVLDDFAPGLWGKSSPGISHSPHCTRNVGGY